MAEETRELAARLLGAPPSSVTFLSHASAALNVLAGSLDWRAGDEVIISDLEFPSNVLPWLRLKHAGVRLIAVPGEAGRVAWQRIAERISARTRLISLSLVSYKTGAYFPHIPELASAARRAGAIVSVDATQALGRCPVSLEGVDYLMASSYKWLLAPHGLALVYLSPALRERLEPAGVGWYSAANIFTPERFERYELKAGAECLAGGMPNFASIYGLRAALRFLLEVGAQRIAEGLPPMVQHLSEELAGMGSPFFFEKPKPRIFVVEHSWALPGIQVGMDHVSPYWPYAPDRVILLPDFTNGTNAATRYASPFSLPVFNKYLLLAADEMEKGLKSYRHAALNAPARKRVGAFHEVLLAEQLQRMMRSEQALLQFEDLRLTLATPADVATRVRTVDRMTTILKEELARTYAARDTQLRDSRLGYEWEEDYFYTPDVLTEKIQQIRAVLDRELPAYRKRHNLLVADK